MGRTHPLSSKRGGVLPPGDRGELELCRPHSPTGLRATVVLLGMLSGLLAQAPTVLSTSPVQNALNVPLGTTVSVTFDVDINAATVNAATFVVNGSQSGLISGNYGTVTTTATFTPGSPFKAGELVTVTLTTGIQSSGGTALAAPHGWSFTSETLGGSAVYAAAVNYSVGNSPRSVTAADLDGDGNTDLAVANRVDNNVSVLLGNGDGTFAAKTDYGVGSTPLSVIAADLDSDGDIDLAMVNNSSNSVSVLLNRNSTADLAISPGNLAFGSTKIGAADSLSLTVYNHGVDSTLQVSGVTSSNTVFTATPSSFSVLPGDSATVTVTFTPTAMATYADSLTIASNDPQNPAANVYVSGSGNPIVAIFPTHNALNVPLGTAISVTFGVAINPATLNANTFVVHGGYTGKLSGAYAYDSGTKTATFTPGSPFKVGEQVSVTVTRGVQTPVGDPLITSYAWDFAAEVLGGSGDFSLTRVPAGNYNFVSMVTGDWDGDNDLDIVYATANPSGDTLNILSNQGAGDFTATSQTVAVEKPLKLITGDWDNDGFLDVASVNENNSVSFYRSNGTGSIVFQSTVSVTADGPASVTVGDWDGDGDLDLAVGQANASNIVSILVNNGSGTFVETSVLSEGYNHFAIISGDWDNDGDRDLAVGNDDSAISIIYNDGAGGFNQADTLWVWGQGTRTSSFIVTDANSDGNTDLIALAIGGVSELSLFINQGNGNFAEATSISVGTDPFGMGTGDWDGDGDIDLVVSHGLADTVSFFMNDNTGIYNFSSSIRVTSNIPEFLIGDWDGDGDLDLAVANSDSTSITIMFNEQGYSARLSSLESELSGDIPLDYHISQPSGLPTNLQVDYSVNSGASWVVAAIVGDTTALGPENYDGTLIWQSEANLPGVDLPAVQLRITPYTADSTGRSYTTLPFRLDNNHEPVATIGLIAGEQSGDVTLGYTLADDEGDTLAFAAEYSANRGGAWQSATITGQTGGLDQTLYAGSFVWDTGADLPGHEDSLTWFRITPSDNEPGTADTLILHVDNNEPPALTITSASIDSVVSRVTLDYLLTDAESDTLAISANYSLDGGQSWLASAVSLTGRIIGPDDYGGSVDWLAFANGLVGTTPNVQLRLLPRDYDAGAGDTLSGLTVIYYPGDYTGDLLISTNDLLQFAAAWNADPQDVAYELGPATGTVPDLTPQPDGVLDFEDLVVFVQMWNWSFANNGFAKSIPMLAKTITSDPSLRLIQVVPENLWEWDGRTVIRLEGDVPVDLMMIDGLMTVNPRQVRLRDIQAGGYLSARWAAAPLFVQANADSSQVLFAIAGLSPRGDQGAASEAPLLTFEADLGNRGEQTLTLDYTLWNTTGQPIESGTLSLEIENLLPKQYALHQNYPNPFNPVTTIRYELPRPAKTVLVVYNIVGQEVVRLVADALSPGYHQTIWDGRDRAGRQVASGIYIVRLTTPVWSQTMKMVLLK